ncbi:Mg-dependent DNase [Lactarius deliciosus]|nr:Mg-dependent DNase [Lactarius deliciosus]
MYVRCKKGSYHESNPTSELSLLNHSSIAVNLTDPVFRGRHRGRQKHDDDLSHVLERSRHAGMVSMIIVEASVNLYATVRCHPTRSKEFENDPTIGECGLDYDRTHFAPAAIQQKHFRDHQCYAKKYHLPLFLHSRAAHNDFVQILREEGLGEDGGKAVGGRGGVVHSFTGSTEDANDYITMGFHISINDCFLKTEDNLAMVKSIDRRRIIFETDAPWCSMTSTHASRRHIDTLPADLRELYLPPAVREEAFVTGRPVKAWVAHEVKEEVSFHEFIEQEWRNTTELFGL